jgi:hypothetical protein
VHCFVPHDEHSRSSEITAPSVSQNQMFSKSVKRHAMFDAATIGSDAPTSGSTRATVVHADAY